MIPVAVAFGLAALRALPILARPAIGAARYFARPVSRGTMAAVTVGPTAVGVGLAVAEHESGGALSEAAIDGAIATINAGIDSGILTYENLEDQINRIGYIVEVSNVTDKALQNQAVRLAMGGTDAPDAQDIHNGKMAAISWQITDAPLLAAKSLVRMGVVDKVHSDRAEADRYLADQFVNDLVIGAEVRALRDHPVTEDDVKTVIAEALENGTADRMIPPRIRSGLEQKWPELFEAPAPAVPVTPRVAAAEPEAEESESIGIAMLPALDIDALPARSVSSLFNEVVQDVEHAGPSLSVAYFCFRLFQGLANMFNFEVGGVKIFDGLTTVFERQALEFAQDMAEERLEPTLRRPAAPVPAGP